MTAFGKLCVFAAATILVALAIYISALHQWAPFLPEVIPPGAKDVRMDAKVGVASAIQETVGLLTTLSLAITAFFAFAVSKDLEKTDNSLGIGLLLTAVYSVPLTIGNLNAYEIYRAIALQLDSGYFFIKPLSSSILWQTWCLIGCVVVSLFAFVRRYLTP
jgi:hypothetical protein